MASDYKYARTNSKGEKILRRDTDEDLEFVENYLTDRGIEYKIRYGASMMWIKNLDGKLYSYYWTTGRWAPRSLRVKKHYASRGIEDFVNRFLNKYVEEKKDEHTDV